MEMKQNRDKAVVPDKRNFYAHDKKRLPRQRDIDTIRARRKRVPQTWHTSIDYDTSAEIVPDSQPSSDDAEKK